MSQIAKLRKISLNAATDLVGKAEAKYVNKPDFKDKGIEPKIRLVVIALVAHGFPTQNSCEGHLESNLYPWVRLEPGRRERLPTKRAVHQHIRKIYAEIEQLNTLLFDFYNRVNLTADRVLEATPDWESSRLSDSQLADWYLDIRAKRYLSAPGYTLQCAGANALLTMPDELIGPKRAVILKNRQRDMLAFGKFLVSKL